MIKFRSVLSNDDLGNKSLVKEYLEWSFKKRRSKKNAKLYINICQIFPCYPNTIKNILDAIPKLGYYKDYFYILMYSKNNDLDEYIYQLIISQLRLDLDNLEKGLPISTLGKWLPREKSKINLECNFVDKFNRLFFPLIKNKFKARCEYRKTKALINNVLGTIEPILCSKNYTAIDYNKVAPYALKKKKRILLKHPECIESLETHESEIINSMTLTDFVKDFLMDKYPAAKMVNMWDPIKLHKSIPFLANVINNSVCIGDLSSDTYAHNSEFFVLGITLLVNYLSINQYIFIGKTKICPKGTIKYRANCLLKYIGPCRDFNVEYYYDTICATNPDIGCLIFVTTKKINYDIDFLQNHHLKFMHIRPKQNSYNLIYYDGEKIIKKKNLTNTLTRKTISAKQRISIITNNSREFSSNDIRGCIILIIFAIFIFLTK